MFIQDPISRKNQLKAFAMTGGRIPHPNLTPLRSPTGIPLMSPAQVIEFGRPDFASSYFPATTPYAPPPARPTAHAVAHAGSYADSYYFSHDSWLGDKVDWIQDHVFPLPQLAWIGDTLYGGRVWTRLAVGCMAGFLLLLVRWEQSATLPWTAAGAVAIVGFITTSLLGKLVLFCTRTLAFFVFLAICAAIAVLTYLAVTSIHSTAGSKPQTPDPQYQYQQASTPPPPYHHARKTATKSAARGTGQLPTDEQFAEALKAWRPAQTPAPPANEQPSAPNKN